MPIEVTNECSKSVQPVTTLHNSHKLSNRKIDLELEKMMGLKNVIFSNIDKNNNATKRLRNMCNSIKSSEAIEIVVFIRY